MSEYTSKYMKYKNRYLDLKKKNFLKQFGGSSEKNKQDINDEGNSDGGDGIGDNANTSETIDAEGIGDSDNASEKLDTDGDNADNDNDGGDQEDEEDDVDEIVNTDEDVIDKEQELQLSEIEEKLNKPLYILTDEEKSKRPTLVNVLFEIKKLDDSDKNNQIYKAALKNLTMDDYVISNNENIVIIKELYDRASRGYEYLKGTTDYSEGIKSPEYNALNEIYGILEKDMNEYPNVENFDKLKEDIKSLLDNFKKLFEVIEEKIKEKEEKEIKEAQEATENYIVQQNNIENEENELNETSEELKETKKQIKKTQIEFDVKKLNELKLQEILEELKGSNSEKIMLEIKQDKYDNKELMEILETDPKIKDIKELSINEMIDLIKNKLEQAKEITTEVKEELKELEDKGSELQSESDNKEEKVIDSKKELYEIGKDLKKEIYDVEDKAKELLPDVEINEKANDFLLEKYKDSENFDIIEKFLRLSGGARKNSKEEWLNKYLN